MATFVAMLTFVYAMNGCDGSSDGESQPVAGRGGGGTPIVAGDDLARAPTDGGSATIDRPAALPQAEAQRSSPLSQEMAMVDESADTAWPTEVLNVSAGGVLKEIARHIRSAPDAPSLAQSIRPYLASDVSCTALVPDDLATHSVAGVTVRNGTPGEARADGAEALAHELFTLADALHRDTAVFEFKIVRVEETGDDRATTSIIYHGLGTPSATGARVQQNAHWVAEWDVSHGMDKPLLRGMTAADFEQLETPEALFTDCTGSAVGDQPFVADIATGIDQLWGKIDVSPGFSLYGEYGIALGDVDNDGLDDLYVCQPTGLPNLLLKHNPDGSVTDITLGSGVEILNDTFNALFADVNNDGNQDLILGFGSHVALMRGNGDGTFETANALEVTSAMAFSVADYDADGRLDLYIARYGDNRQRGGADSLFDSNSGFANSLWRNDGDFAFVNVTTDVGLDVNNRRFSFAAIWEDYDNDGDPDLYVANDFGRNNLYRNDGGSFADVAAEAGVEDQAAGMGVTWADVNHDGFMDLYVSNMFSSAGGRITYQREFAPGGVGEAASQAQRFGRGNSLFLNQGDGSFVDASEQAHVLMGRWSWGAEFADLNNDGEADIVVPNGYITNHQTKDL